MGGRTGDDEQSGCGRGAVARRRLAREFVLRRGDWTLDHDSLAVLMTEYDRRGVVEKAAAAFVLAGLCGSDHHAQLTALIEAVRTNGEFHG